VTKEELVRNIRVELDGRSPVEAAVITPDGNLALCIKGTTADPMQFFLVTVEEASLVTVSAGRPG
jgi:hypothetical protein